MKKASYRYRPKVTHIMAPVRPFAPFSKLIIASNNWRWMMSEKIMHY